MKRSVFWMILIIFFLELRSAYGDHIAGNFQWPFNLNQAWTAPNCNQVGYKEERDLHFIQWYEKYEKYHAADDWNGICGGSTDKGAPLYALTNGTVVWVDNRTNNESIGKTVYVRYTLPDGTKVDSAYYHVNSVLVKQNDPVSKGKQIATIGDANGYYKGNAHLHWEIRRNLTMSWRQNPYYNPLPVATALKYTSPSLFVDDRVKQYPVGLSQSAWTYFYVPSNAPSSTAYIRYQTLNLSLKKAADLGVIYKYIYVYENGWNYYPDITKVFFLPGKKYAIYGYYSGVTLNILRPGDKYRADRARQDMLRAAQKDSRLVAVKTETYGEELSWDPAWELRYMKFTSLKGVSAVKLYQATNKSNPLARFTGYYDPETGVWSGWIWIDWNQLD